MCEHEWLSIVHRGWELVVQDICKICGERRSPIYAGVLIQEEISISALTPEQIVRGVGQEV